jgi:hypothetical protein
MPGATGGGEAGWHATCGWVFVACDALCVGESDTPTDAANVTFEHIAAANHAMVGGARTPGPWLARRLSRCRQADWRAKRA